jgi:hypothetical protein
LSRRSIVAFAAILVAGCYPRYDWRDHRPDCARGWCGYVASFPGRVTHAVRDIPVGHLSLPLSLDVVSVGEVTFAIGAFELLPGSNAGEARATFERKLLSDVGAETARTAPAPLRAADRSAVDATRFEAEGVRDGKSLRVEARLAERGGRMIEVLVIGSSDTLESDVGRQAAETFFTSVRLD